MKDPAAIAPPIWIAIRGRNYQGGGRAAFYARSEEEMIDTLRDRGFLATEWPHLYEDEAGYWIRTELISSCEEVLT